MSNMNRGGISACALVLALLSPLVWADAPGPDAGITKKADRPVRMKVAPQKPNGSGIELRYRMDATPVAGKALALVLSLDRIVAPDASVRFRTDGGLRLAGGGEAQALAPGQPVSLTLEVVPGAEGTGYLHVFTTQGGVTSVTSIPVTVGKEAAPKPSADLKSTAEGDKLISMPVK